MATEQSKQPRWSPVLPGGEQNQESGPRPPQERATAPPQTLSSYRTLQRPRPKAMGRPNTHHTRWLSFFLSFFWELNSLTYGLWMKNLLSLPLIPNQTVNFSHGAFPLVNLVHISNRSYHLRNFF